MMLLNRGDIVIVNFNPRKADEIGKIRPAIVISDEIDNSEFTSVIVVPLSTKLIDNTQPYRVRIVKKDGLKNDSDAVLNHIRAVSKIRIYQKIGKVSQKEYESIKLNLCKIL